MNVLVITDYYLPHWTGISKSLSYTLQTIKKKHSVTVLTIKYKKELAASELINGVQIIRLPYLLTFSRSKFSPFFWIHTLPYLTQADVVLVNSPSAHIFPLSILVKLLGKRLIVLHQGDLILPKGFVNFLIEKLFDFCTLFSLFLADSIATFTFDYAKNSRVLKPFINKSTSFIPVLPSDRNNTPSPLRDRLIKIKKKHRVLFGFGGRFVEEKGFDILLKAVPKVISAIPSAHFLYAGEHTIQYEKFYDSIRKYYEPVKKNITELGLLSDNDLGTFYSYLDFVIIPSRSDCFPFFQAEAMAKGIPSIVSDIAGARYLVKISGFGYIFKTEDSEDLSSTLIKAYKNKGKLNKYYAPLKKLLDPHSNEKRIIEFIG